MQIISQLLRGMIITVPLMYSLAVKSQTQQTPKIQNPNAASLGTFGETPMNLYTGTPNINIPIHTLSYGKIQVPIALRYHPSSVKPSVQPGWVGLGWNLQSYGMVSRKTRGTATSDFEYIDELYFPDHQGGGLSGADTYFPAPGAVTGSSGSEKANVSNWDATSRLKDYFTMGSSVYPNGKPPQDMEADEFSFNFGSYSGKFYYAGPQNGWQVISSGNIKVELNDFSTQNYFLTKYEIFGAITQYNHFGPNYSSLDQSPYVQSRMFKGFTITVEDGTKYIFGGPDAVEFHCPYGLPDAGKIFYADNWLLKKIIDVNGNEVSFEYKRSYPTVNLFFGQTDHYSSVVSGSSNWPCTAGSSFSNGTVNTRKHSGVLQWPMYLTKISSPSESIEFQSTISAVLRYTDVQLREIIAGNGNQNNLFDLTLLASNPNLPQDPANVDNLQWEKLDWVIIKNAKQEVVKKYNFYYQPTSSTGQRLTLNSITQLSAASIANGSYTFNYNAVAALPMYLGDYTDHWGYYNNKTVEAASLTQIIANNTKETDINHVSKGLLTSIKYPTGGSTVFTWEPHDYSKVVSLTRNSLYDATGYAGGSRVSRVQNFSSEGAVLSEKKYYYKKNYSSGVSISSLPSSGILNGKPKYYLTIVNRYNSDQTASFNIDKISLNSLSTYSYNAQGSHIGYNQVVEVNSDGSYTKNYFTSYEPEPGLNDGFHYDRSSSFIGWSVNEDTYIPMNSLELERGNPVGIFKYTPHNILVQKKLITYRSDAGRFNSFVKKIDLNAIYPCNNAIGIIFASAISEYNYVYYPVKTEVTDYDREGKNPIASSSAFTYNSYNLISKKEEIDSKGIKRTTLYKYPFDFLSNSTFNAMVNAHILSPVVETSNFIELPILVPQLTLTKTNFFSPHTGIFVPSNIQVQKEANPIETIQQFNTYDTRGNLLEAQKTNNVKEVYIWGYNGQYPIAKIIGSSYSAVNSLITPSMRTIFDNATLQYSDVDTRNALQNIRTGLAATKALVTTYTYAPLLGITSETDPNGRSIYYSYDSWGRLEFVKDQNNNVVKTFDYHYKQ